MTVNTLSFKTSVDIFMPRKVIVSRVEVEYNGHADAGEQCFGSRFYWSEVACGLAGWPYMRNSSFFPTLDP